jgi:hypothetical protein
LKCLTEGTEKNPIFRPQWTVFCTNLIRFPDFQLKTEQISRFPTTNSTQTQLKPNSNSTQTLIKLLNLPHTTYLHTADARTRPS